MSPRRLHNLVAALPSGAATHGTDSVMSWTFAEHLLAALVEAVRQTNILLLQAHFKPTVAGGEWPPKLERVPRPWDEPEPAPETVTIHHWRRALLGAVP